MKRTLLRIMRYKRIRFIIPIVQGQNKLIQFCSLLVILMLLCVNPVFATNWCEDANVGQCYTFDSDGGEGGTISDDSSNNNDLSITNATWKESVPDSEDGFNGTSIYSVDFNGTDAYACVADNGSLDYTTYMTALLWVYFDGTQSGWNRAVEKGFRKWSMIKYSSSSRIYPYNDAQGNGEILDAWGTGTWNHYAFTYDTDDNKVVSYLNGVAGGNPESEGTDLSTDDNQFCLGSDYNQSTYAELQMDEFASFSIALDSTDINDIMDNGLVQAASSVNVRIKGGSRIKGGVRVNKSE